MAAAGALGAVAVGMRCGAAGACADAAELAETGRVAVGCVVIRPAAALAARVDERVAADAGGWLARFTPRDPPRCLAASDEANITDHFQDSTRKKERRRKGVEK